MGTTEVARTRSALPGYRFDSWIVGSLVLFTMGQFLFLQVYGGIPDGLRLQAALVAAAVALFVAQSWRIRRMLPAHADMLLLMLAWGGFGMLWGWQLDGAMQAMPPDSGSAEMRASAVMAEADDSHGADNASGKHDVEAEHHGQGQGQHDAHRHRAFDHNHAGHSGMVYSGWFRWFNAMNGLMLLFAFPPSVLWARCLQPYRLYPWRLGWVLALDAAGMVVGMMAGGRMLGHPLSAITGAPVAAHHLAMLAGMMAGMYVTMLLRRWMAPLPRVAG